MRDDGWSGIGRLKRNRRGNGHALRTARRHPDGAEAGWLTGGRNVWVVRDGAQDAATNCLALPAAEVRQRERLRAPREAVRRVGIGALGLTGCQARSARVTRHQMTCGLMAGCGLELERQA